MTGAVVPAASVTTAAASTLWTKYVGDDWLFAYTYTDLSGDPIPLSGGVAPQAELYVRDQAAPALTLTVDAGVTILDPVGATVLFKVPRASTATIAGDGICPQGYPTRLQVQLLDANGNLQTFRVDPINVVDPRQTPLLPAAALPPTASVPAQATPSVVLTTPAETGGASTGAASTYPVTIATPGQTVIPLPTTPDDLSTVRLMVNGVQYAAPLISVTGTAVTWTNTAFALDPTDTVSVSYT